MQTTNLKSAIIITTGSCDAAGFKSKLVSIPAPGTEDDDKNPPRIAPRSLFDASIGDDNPFGGEKRKWSLFSYLL